MKCRTILIGLLLCSTVLSQPTKWQTTRQGQSSSWWSLDVGNCLLEYSKITMTINNFHLDVEEEAHITPFGSITRGGDPNTLEILGEFTLSEGSTLRSMLLWNGDVILKAKLKTRAEADSAYENVVDREKPQIIPIDPALIEYLGNNRYRFKIYPTSMGRFRKIRILYSVPLKTFTDGPAFEILTAFTAGTTQYPSQIPLEFIKGSSTSAHHILQHGTNKRTVQYGATYLISIADFFSKPYTWSIAVPKAFRLTADNNTSSRAFSTRIEDGAAQGYYTAVFTSVPDSIRKAISNGIVPHNALMDVKISSGEKAYIIDLKELSYFGAFLKSSSAWDSTLTWTAYNSSGKAIYSYQHELIPDTTDQTVLPLMWAGKYSLKEGLGNLGALFGFVDKEMSLLALESDSMSRECMDKYAQGGVPLLDPEEIVIKPENMPRAPKENIIIEHPTTVGIQNNPLSILAFRVNILPDGRIVLQFNNKIQGTITAALYDAKGRVVHRWNDVRTDGSAIDLTMPRNLKGMYVLRVQKGNETFQNKLILH